MGDFDLDNPEKQPENTDLRDWARKEKEEILLKIGELTKIC